MFIYKCLLATCQGKALGQAGEMGNKGRGEQKDTHRRESLPQGSHHPVSTEPIPRWGAPSAIELVVKKFKYLHLSGH